MSLETGTNISDLNSSNPTTNDNASQGDDHLRLIKVVLKTDFPSFVTSATGVVATQAELSVVGGVTGGVVTASKALVVDASSKLDVLNVDNVTINLNTISTTDTNGDLIVAPNGTGDVDFNACSIMIDTGEGIKDAGGDEYMMFTESTTPVNYFGVTSADTGTGPSISSAGGDANIDINLAPKGTGAVNVQGGFITSETTSLSGAGAVAITGAIHEITTTGTDALTLADGVEGQRLCIVMVTDGGDGTLTPTSGGGYTTITFADAGDSCELLFTNSNWYVLGSGGLAGGPVVA